MEQSLTEKAVLEMKTSEVYQKRLFKKIPFRVRFDIRTVLDLTFRAQTKQMLFAANEKLVVDGRWGRIDCLTHIVGCHDFQFLGVLDHHDRAIAVCQIDMPAGCKRGCIGALPQFPE